MKTLLLLVPLILTIALQGNETVRRTDDGRILDVTWEMSILQVDTTPNNDLRIVASLPDNEKKSLIVNIPGGKREKGRRERDGSVTYRFPLYLEATEAGTEGLDQVVSSYFGKGSHVTFFKQRGYSGGSLSKPEQLGKTGGTVFLSDPGIDGSFVWSITIKIDIRLGRGVRTRIRRCPPFRSGAYSLPAPFSGRRFVFA